MSLSMTHFFLAECSDSLAKLFPEAQHAERSFTGTRSVLSIHSLR